MLLEHGHPDAPFYAVHRIWEEAALISARTNQRSATEALLIQMAVSAMFSKDAGREFNDIIKRMTDGG